MNVVQDCCFVQHVLEATRNHKMSHCDVDFLNFCQLMLDVGQFCLVRTITAGSRVEVEGNNFSLAEFSNMDSMDIDSMISSRDEYAFSVTDDVPSDYRGKIFRYVTDGIHPGYVRLLRESDGCVKLSYTDAECERNGPANTYNQRLSVKKLYNLTEEQVELVINKEDIVFAHHSPYWPREAVDWITRHQPQGSPSHDVIRRVVGYGFDFVCVSHKGYIERGRNHEWRFSFSMAELILIKNWSRQQRTVYRTIRVLHKRSLDTGRVSRLRTYHYKTLMLWAVETKSQGFWDDITLFDSVRALLIEMIYCVKIKYLYHYFIPTNNLFDHLLSEDLSHDVNVLLCTCEDTDLIFRVLNYCVDEEWRMSNRRRFVILPQLLYTSLTVSASLNNGYDSFTDLFCSLKRDSIRNSVNDAVGIAYGLIRESSLQQKNRTVYPVTESYSGFNLFSENECKFRSSDENVYQIFKNSGLFNDTVNNYYWRGKTVDYESWVQCCESADVVMMTAKMSAVSKQKKYQLYSRCADWMLAHRSLVTAVNVEHQESVTRYEADDKCLEALTITICEVCPVKTLLKDFSEYYSYWPVRAPTVPISWFINAAYTANHYYTLLSDYKTSADICDKMINAYSVSYGNKKFAEFGLPVLLSTQWSQIYDTELQQIIGLAALCRFVIYGSDNRSVHLAVCPIQFALYLKLRCVLDIFVTGGVTSSTTCRIEYQQHRDVICSKHFFFRFGTAALTAALTAAKKAVLRRFL